MLHLLTQRHHLY